MSITMRLLLLACAVAAFAYIIVKIRRSEMKIADSTFWFLFALSLVLLAVFPQIAFFFAAIFNFESPSNLVFLYVIAVLLVREFITTKELSALRNKTAFLVQALALKEKEDVEERADGEGGVSRGRRR